MFAAGAQKNHTAAGFVRRARRRSQTVSQDESKERPGRPRPCEALTTRLGSAVRLDPLHRPGAAIFARTAKPQQTESSQTARHFYFGAADYFSATETEPPLVEGAPRPKMIKALQQLQLFFRSERARVHAATVAAISGSTNRSATRLRPRCFSDFGTTQIA